MIEVIIILGKGVKADGSLPAVVQHEIQYAAQLCQLQPIPAIILAGDYWGLLSSGSVIAEAEVMRRWALGKIPPQTEVICETQSRDTIGNLLFSKDILEQRGWRNVLILSSADHLPRVQYIAEHVFGHDYELSYHGHQHSYTLRQYLHTLRYERLARWYAHWFFYRLAHHPPEQWQQYHFMYHSNIMLHVARRIIQRPVHR